MSKAFPYTLRKAGSPHAKILTFNKNFLKKIEGIHPWAWAVFWANLKQEIEKLGGKAILLDCDQRDHIESLFPLKAFNFDAEQRKITDCVADCYRIRDCEEDIQILDRFAKKFIQNNGV